jgi:hypothetical protein
VSATVLVYGCVPACAWACVASQARSPHAHCLTPCVRVCVWYSLFISLCLWCLGLDLVVALMNVGELAQVRVASKYAYDALGRSVCPHSAHLLTHTHTHIYIHKNHD